MWSDAARQASLSSRGAGGGGGGMQGGGMQAGLAQAGAASRSRWGGGGAAGGGGYSKITIGGQGGVVAAHQSGVHGVARRMKYAGAAMPGLPPAYYPNVASSSYGYGRAGMPGL